MARTIRHQVSRLARVFCVTVIAVVAFVSLSGVAGAAGPLPNQNAIYTITNATSGNQVVAFTRNADGTLSKAATYETGELGTGVNLGSQGSVVLSEDGRWLLAVDAGSNAVSVFSVAADGEGLTLIDNVPSGGQMPVSIAYYHHLVYVLNAGGNGNITGFRLGSDGTLLQIPESTRGLGSDNAGPAEVSFNSNGTALVVTEKNTNDIATYTLVGAGYVSPPTITPSNGAVPFGFAFDNANHAFVSEAGPGAVSPYWVGNDGSVTSISATVVTHQVAACWVVVTNNGRFVYDANAHTTSISGFRVGANGSITLLNANGITGETGPGSAPIDMALSSNSQYLSVLSAANGTIVTFKVDPDGSLTRLSITHDASLNGAVGLAAQ
ncbi:MAG TPA: beta-propeller fold lactonase family protein [Thermomicrobiaceae bacterium]|nr:beta-propeller fold lactonase family protein [Thermomicrobiaceae bacterium]